MATSRVLSVQTGRARDAQWAGRLRRTAIDKHSVQEPVAVGRLGLAGDEQADADNHGGPEQAVYAYAREDLDWWVECLGRDLRNGVFGENLTTSALDVTGAVIGEIWQVGTAAVQVTAPRIPCSVFGNWLGEDRWVKRFAAAGRPGAYLRVLTPGQVAAGDPVKVLERPSVRVTLAEAVLAYYGDLTLLAQLMRVEGRGRRWDEIAASVFGRADGPGRVVEPVGAGQAADREG